jgi:hypothetical protein
MGADKVAKIEILSLAGNSGIDESKCPKGQTILRDLFASDLQLQSLKFLNIGVFLAGHVIEDFHYYYNLYHPYPDPYTSRKHQRALGIR